MDWNANTKAEPVSAVVGVHDVIEVGDEVYVLVESKGAGEVVTLTHKDGNFTAKGAPLKLPQVFKTFAR